MTGRQDPTPSRCQRLRWDSDDCDAMSIPHGGNQRSLRIALAITGVGLLVGALGILASRLAGEDPILLFKDMAILAGTNPFVGFYSVVGVGLWVASGSIALFTAILLWRFRPGPQVRFLAFFGLLTLIVAVDDQFLLHEWGLDRLPGPGQPIYVVFYGAAFLGFAWTQRRLLLSEQLPLFLFAAAFLAGSVVLDNLGDLLGVKPAVFDVGEDLFKLVGALLWSAYGVLRCYGFLQQALRPGIDPPGTTPDE